MVTLQAPVRIGSKSWQINFSSGLSDPRFYIYVDGELVAETKQTSYVIAREPGTSFMVEVLDSSSDLPLQVFPGNLRLCWYKVENAEEYRVDEYVGAAWVSRKRYRGTNGYLQFESRFLEDGQNHTFRIVPIGADGNEGTAKQFQILMVRHPDVPDVGYEYHKATNKVDITEN